jgi:hypothetical protein
LKRHPARINIARRRKQNRRASQTLRLTASFIADLLCCPLREVANLIMLSLDWILHAKRLKLRLNDVNI